MATDLPPEFLRGIQDNLRDNKRPLSEYNNLTSGHFKFHASEGREDGFIEMSINWRLDDDVVLFTLNQKNKKGQYQYRHGAVLFLVKKINEISGWVKISNEIRFERQELPGNDYHGNILVNKKVASNRQNLFGSLMAIHVEEFYVRD